MAEWTGPRSAAGRPRPGRRAGRPHPRRPGDPSPIRYVVYIIKENRTYDQVLGDLPQGNGDPSLCLFPERVTPNIHAIARQFVLLDNFYANAEVSASGHEWSMAGYSSEFVEKSWPVNYGHQTMAATFRTRARATMPRRCRRSGYLWDRSAAAGVTYRSYGEFTENPDRPGMIH
jgi:phospholipase C